ncbi:double-strand break repair protein AddB [Frigidibacter sp. MR17.14]|uniref:double-strand break repair protein AddB n=1 Tax=Frigidibacter sp. MR17.14 TaxID=3126509 RepID=UPI0030129D58
MAELYALPCGADFPKAFVAGLIAKMAGRPPEAMARVTVYANSGRMRRKIAEAFDAHGTRLLPRLRLITDLGSDPMAALPPAVPKLRRRLELGQLVQRLLNAAPDLAPGAGAADLAESLQDLMAEMQDEGVSPEALERLDIADHAAHWQRSLAFIRIVARFFEGGDAAPDAEARQRALVAALAAAWAETPPADPVVVAGSTGSRGATALFLEAVARLPEGWVVLPGFDFDQPGPVWQSLFQGRFPAEDHPQYRHAALLRALDLAPSAVRLWDTAPAPAPDRNRLLSLALRPAPVTDQWLAEGPRLPDLRPATQAMTLIEAPDPRTEALAIALRLRRAAEDGQRAALITPDRMLARRVIAALDRWGITPDDSAGQPLILSPPGRFLRHVAALYGERLSVEALLTLLKHPITATGNGARGDHLRHTRDLELRLRRRGPAFPGPADLAAWAETSPAEGRAAWAAWLGDALGPTPALGGDRMVLDWVEGHLALAETLAAGPGGSAEASELWREAGGREAARVMQGLRTEAPHGGAVSPDDYRELVASLMNSGSVRGSETVHPGIAIWGTLEARVQGADLVILGGLVDGVWPQQPPPDPWMSRRMRMDAGLRSPERAVGLSAHDFQQAVGAPEVVLSRALKSAEAETVPSRWLNRMVNLMAGLPTRGGPEALAAMRARGAELVALARAVERPAGGIPRATRPAPQPPLDQRPTELAVTGIRSLIRDPYQIYARRILRLEPLPPIGIEPDARMRGTVLHHIIERFVRERPEAEDQPAARDRLMEIAEAELAAQIPWAASQRMWRARLERVAAAFVATEFERMARGKPVVLERAGSVRLDDLGFTLTARPDRIDQLTDGRVHIYDYKTGSPPTKKQQEAFDKQMLLEAAMAERGGFEALGHADVEGITYIGMKDPAGAKPDYLEGGVTMKTWEGLERLLTHYLKGGRGYVARRAMHSTQDASDYDHLSRFGEWDVTDAPVETPVDGYGAVLGEEDRA